MKIDWTKPIQTTDGRPARLLCADLKSNYSIKKLGAQSYVAAILNEFGFEELAVLFKNGSGGLAEEQNSEINLINAPPRTVKCEGWAVQHKPTLCFATHPYASREAGEQALSLYSDSYRLTRIEWDAPEPEPEKPDDLWIVYRVSKDAHRARYGVYVNGEVLCRKEFDRIKDSPGGVSAHERLVLARLTTVETNDD